MTGPTRRGWRATALAVALALGTAGTCSGTPAVGAAVSAPVTAPAPAPAPASAPAPPARAVPPGWEAAAVLQAVGDRAAPPPPVLVPKQSVMLQVTVWMPEGVNWAPNYPDWDMRGATVLPLMTLSPSIERDRGTFQQRGATQNYLVTPLAEGTLRLVPDAIDLDPSAPDDPPLTLPPVALQVVLPDGAGGLDRFLPATSIRATQDFTVRTADGQSQALTRDAVAGWRLQAGQLLVRRVVVEALGVQGAQIPAPGAVDGAVQHEHEAADLNTYGDFTGGRREDRWSYAPGTADTLDLPPIDIRWYDLASRTFRTVTLDGVRLPVDAAPAGDPRLRPSWVDRLAALPARAVWAALAVLVLLAASVRWRAALRRGAAGLMRAVRDAWRDAETVQFGRLCAAVLVRGVADGRAAHRFDRWRARAAGPAPRDDAVHRLPALADWSRARFAAGAAPFPGRLRVLAALCALRRQARGRVTRRSRHALPALGTPGGAGDPPPVSGPVPGAR